jgi:hypothetical protein
MLFIGGFKPFLIVDFLLYDVFLCLKMRGYYEVIIMRGYYYEKHL